jgi:signal peptidase I
MLRKLVRSWAARVAIEGGSMRPTLDTGDWVLVDPAAYAARLPRRGELVLFADPRDGGRVLIKRVDQVSLDTGELFVLGDAAEASTDSRAFGSIAASDVEGKPWLRYWPLRRFGRIR